MALRSEDIAKSLRQRLMIGEWSGSGMMATERVLSAEYGVARNTLRKAVDQLVAEGLVSRHVGRGTQILPQPLQAPVVPLGDEDTDLVQIIDKLSGTSPIDIMQLRLILEPAAAAACAAHATANELISLREQHEICNFSTDMIAAEAADMAFHRAIFAASRNDLLAQLNAILEVIRQQPEIVEIRRRGYGEARRLATCSQHDVIMRAIEDRDAAAAAQAMRDHLIYRTNTLFGSSVY